MIKLVSLVAITASSISHASQINYLEVNENTVSFSTTDVKQHTLPSCVSSENEEKWSISLTSNSGRAMYSMILTAMAQNGEMGLSVTSANDCAAVDGIERAGSVLLTASSTVNSSAGGNSVGIYKSDGVTRLGTLVNISERGYWRYVSGEPASIARIYTPSNGINTNIVMYFLTSDCSGTPYSTKYNTVFRNSGFNNGSYYKSSSESLKDITVNSSIDSGGRCSSSTTQIRSLYIGEPYEDTLCGFNSCMVKED